MYIFVFKKSTRIKERRNQQYFSCTVPLSCLNGNLQFQLQQNAKEKELINTALSYGIKSKCTLKSTFMLLFHEINHKLFRSPSFIKFSQRIDSIMNEKTIFLLNKSTILKFKVLCNMKKFTKDYKKIYPYLKFFVKQKIYRR